MVGDAESLSGNDPDRSGLLTDLESLSQSGISIEALARHAVAVAQEIYRVGAVVLVEVDEDHVSMLASHGCPNSLSVGLNIPGSPEAGLRLRYRGADGRNVTCRSSLAVALTAGGSGWGVLALFGQSRPRKLLQDESPLSAIGFMLSSAKQRRFAQAVLGHSADDALTAMPTLPALVHRVDQLLHSQQRVGIFVIDVDRAGLAADAHASAVGDQLVRTAADRLLRSIPPEDAVARYGGGRLVVLTSEVAGADYLLRRADAIRRGVDGPVEVGGHQHIVSVAVGASLSRPGSTPEGLLEEAGAAAEQARKGGANRPVVFQSALNGAQRQRVRLEADIQRGLEHGEFVPYFQPVVSLEDHNIVGGEALVRWAHPRRGLLTPERFISAAESSGLIIGLGDSILSAACQQAHWWNGPDAAGHQPPVHVAVNVSAVQINEPNLPERVAAALQTAALDPSLLTLEITESAVMADPKRAVSTLRALKELGVGLSIDDFGTGYSSLSYLKQFPVDSLKIDRTFVRGLGDDPDDALIVRAVIRLSDALGVGTIAEGVETEQQAEELYRLGCVEAQGYLYARPEPPEDFADRLVEVGLTED